MSCPNCGSFGAFTIAVAQFGLARITDDGMDDFTSSTNTEWEDDAHCECNDCGHTATVSEFYKPEDIPDCGDAC
jgi:hypothetical protein